MAILTYKDHKATDSEERARMIEMGVDLSEGQTRIGGLTVSRALGDHFVKSERLGLISDPYISEPIPLDRLAMWFKVH